MTKRQKDEAMSRTVDNWSTQKPAPRPAYPVLTAQDVKKIEQRISNWGRKNF